MKIITLILWLSLSFHHAIIAQYDNPPEPILEEEEVKEKEEIFIGTLIPPPTYLASCENDSSDSYDKKDQSDQKLLHYVYTSLNYPDSARVNGIEGIVVVSFLIKKDGWINPKSIQVRRDIGHGCGAEVFRIIHSFNEELGQWSFSGDPVDTRYALPVRFKLN